MYQSNIKQQLIKAQFTTQIYSPRSSYSRYLKEIEQVKTHMIINIDKYILGNLKTEFEKKNYQISMVQFMYYCQKFLKDWNIDLPGREVKMQDCLIELWKEIDVDNKGIITWEDFNSKIIQTSLNLRTLSNNAGIQAPTFTEFKVSLNPSKYQTPIAKIIHITKKNKMAYFREESTVIDFFSTQKFAKITQSSLTKPIFLPQQQLKVQTTIKVKEKNEQTGNDRVSKGISKTVKKNVKVSSYKNTVLDSIYLSDQKYEMLMVSCSDKYIRGYNVENLVPNIACQPQNEDELMLHQFPVEIYNMAWDQVNQVLYGTSKGPTIYQWLVKTDSQREMNDQNGHEGMISIIYMMPRLQLLATGGFDGKLILWDTVNQSVKIKYQQHTRAISGITFDEGLVLLFTSALDHRICVWNPYIGSLIHKIDNPLNVIQIQVIPHTNYLLSIDSGGNVKIREINRFTQVAAFSIFRNESTQQTQQLFNTLRVSQKQKETSIAMCSKKDFPILYYFGTDNIVGYQFNQIQKSSLLQSHSIFTTIKYSHNKLKLYAPLKNNVILWNLLTGKNQDTFYDLTEYDITAFQLVEELGFFIIADSDGNVIQRRISNGSLINKIHRMKASVNFVKIYQLQRNQANKQASSTINRVFYLFCTTQQGEIATLKCPPKGQFEMHRYFSLRGDFSITNGNINQIEFFVNKHILICALSSNEIVMIDVEKRSLLVKVSLGDNIFIAMNVMLTPEKNYFLNVSTKCGKILPFYLPPHTKKFKTSTLLNIETPTTIDCSIYVTRTNRYYVVTQKHELLSIQIDPNILESQLSQQKLIPKWKTQLQKRALQILLIENEQIILILNQSQQFIFVSAQSGYIICNLQPEQIKNQITQNNQIEPILFMKQKTNQILIPSKDQLIIKLQQEAKQYDQTIKRFVDPYFFINYLEQRNITQFNKISNPSWKLNLNLQGIIQQRIQKINSVNDQIQKIQKDALLKISPSEPGNQISKALELHKRWQKEKQKDHTQIQPKNDLFRKINSVGRRSTIKFDTLAFDKKIQNFSRGSSLSSLWKQGEKVTKLSQFSVHTQSKMRQSQDDIHANHMKKFKHTDQIDFTKLQSDPLYRLGLALKSVNNKDRQAQNFIQLARKKQELKLPKIGTQKMKL